MVAKIRPLHPEFWTDEDVVECSAYARLLLMGMWGQACDNGHLRDRSNQLKLRILPADDVNVAELLRELEAADLIHRVDGWVQMLRAPEKWKVDPRYFKTCEKPGCRKPKRKTQRGPDETTARPGVTTDGPTTDGDGDGDGDTAATAAEPTATPTGLIDPHLDVLRSTMRRHTKLQHVRFDATPPAKVDRIRAAIDLHGDHRLVDIALRVCPDPPPAHVGWFLETWETLPPPGQQLAAVEQRFCGNPHHGSRLSPAGVCTACASERKAVH